MDVVNVEEARIAEEAGAVAVMALERVPADIRKDGGVARMSDPGMIKAIKEAVTIPVMAKARIGHFVEAQILEAIGCDYVDESEVLTPADDVHHINKHKFNVSTTGICAASCDRNSFCKCVVMQRPLKGVRRSSFGRFHSCAAAETLAKLFAVWQRVLL